MTMKKMHLKKWQHTWLQDSSEVGWKWTRKDDQVSYWSQMIEMLWYFKLYRILEFLSVYIFRSPRKFYFITWIITTNSDTNNVDIRNVLICLTNLQLLTQKINFFAKNVSHYNSRITVIYAFMNYYLRFSVIVTTFQWLATMIIEAERRELIPIT